MQPPLLCLFTRKHALSALSIRLRRTFARYKCKKNKCLLRSRLFFCPCFTRKHALSALSIRLRRTFARYKCKKNKCLLRSRLFFCPCFTRKHALSALSVRLRRTFARYKCKKNKCLLRSRLFFFCIYYIIPFFEFTATKLFFSFSNRCTDDTISIIQYFMARMEDRICLHLSKRLCGAIRKHL